MTSPLPRTIIGVPGAWPNQSDIVTSIVKNSGGYLFAGMIMMHIDSKTYFQVDVCDHDDNLAEAFRIGGGGKISSDELKLIGDHTFCVYLMGDGGSLESARRFLAAGEALLKCGGLGVKIESAGLAHSSSSWKQFAADEQHGSLMKAFVTYVGDNETYYSCGMHNLGYPDCVVRAPVEPSVAANLIHTFLGYLLFESPAVHSGETFSVDAESPRYRLFKEDCTMFPADDPFHNPFGIWRMVPA